MPGNGQGFSDWQSGRSWRDLRSWRFRGVLKRAAQGCVLAATTVTAFVFVSQAREARLRYRCAPVCAMAPDGYSASYTLPAFRAVTTDQTAVRLPEPSGKTLVLVFWSPDCEACKRLLVTLSDAHGMLQHHPRLSLVTVSSGANADRVKQVLSDVLGEGHRLPVVVDEDSHITGDLFQVRALPTTWVIDGEGIARMRFDGVRDWSHAVAVRMLELTAHRDYCPHDVLVSLQGDMTELCSRY